MNRRNRLRAMRGGGEVSSPRVSIHPTRQVRAHRVGDRGQTIQWFRPSGVGGTDSVDALRFTARHWVSEATTDSADRGGFVTSRPRSRPRRPSRSRRWRASRSAARSSRRRSTVPPPRPTATSTWRRSTMSRRSSGPSSRTGARPSRLDETVLERVLIDRDTDAILAAIQGARTADDALAPAGRPTTGPIGRPGPAYQPPGPKRVWRPGGWAGMLDTSAGIDRSWGLRVTSSPTTSSRRHHCYTRLTTTLPWVEPFLANASL